MQEIRLDLCSDKNRQTYPIDLSRTTCTLASVFDFIVVLFVYVMVVLLSWKWIDNLYNIYFIVRFGEKLNGR